MKKELYIFRHGETDWNYAQKFQGSVNIPLNETGRKQAEQLIEPLSKLKIEIILSSDLDRAKETAQIVAQALNIQVRETELLREANLGKAEGLTKDEIEARFGVETLEAWKSVDPQHLDIGYPQGETGREVQDRCFKSISEFCLQHPHERIGVAAHGGVVRRLGQLAAPELSQSLPIKNGMVHRFSFDTKTLELNLHSFFDWVT